MPDGEKLCFVVGPLGDDGTDVRVHADWLLDGIIRPVFDEFPEFQVKRADQESRVMIGDQVNGKSATMVIMPR